MRHYRLYENPTVRFPGRGASGVDHRGRFRKG